MKLVEVGNMLGPILQGTKISLEPPRREDGALRCAWFADLELSRWWTSPDVPSLKQEEESFERWARDDSSVHWRIVLQGRTIGSAWLHSIDWRNRQAWQGMVIGERAAWGNGYGSETVKLRTTFAFQDLGLERLETSTLATNTGMQRALQRSGFRRIGVRQHRIYIQGAWLDEWIYELLAAEWAQEPGRLGP
jgi:RimJ/RimL family protein N-acetyltransferase